MVQLVLTNSDDIIIDSARVKTQEEILEVLTKWLDEYQFLNGDNISFYDI